MMTLKRVNKYQELKSQYERKIYDLEQMLDISRSFSSTLDSTTLLESIVFSSMAQLHVADAGIFVLDFLNSDSFILKTKPSDMSSRRSTYSIAYSDPMIPILYETKAPVTIEYLEKRCPKSEALNIFRSLNPTLIVPLLLKNHLNGILFLGERFCFEPGANTAYTEYEKHLILTIGSLAAIAIYNAELLERSSTDMMTQLKLKYFFYNILTEKLDQAMNENINLCVLMFDIDFFKHFNDTYGHECGDYVLKKVAGLIKENLRDNDLASRYGGEEFTVLLNNTKKELGLQIAERIRSAIEAYDFVFNDTHMHVTISGGVTEFSREFNPITHAQQLVSQADQGLYMSKHNGRNRITFADPSLLSDNK